MDNNNEENLGIFITGLTGFINLKQGNQITDIVCYNDNTIIYGDDKGNIEILNYIDKKDKSIAHKQIAPMKLKTIGRNRINKLIVINELNILYILCGNNLHYYLLPELDDKMAKNLDFEITNICQNKKLDHHKELLVVLKKQKKIKFYSMEIEIIKLEDLNLNERPIEDTPEFIEWYGDYICYFIKKKETIYFIDLKQNTSSNIPYECSGLLYLNDGWLASSMTIGLFFETNGNPKSMEPLNLENKVFMQFSKKENYLLTLYDSMIVINDGTTLKKVQKISLETKENSSKAVCIVNGIKKAFILIQDLNKLYILRELKETPFEEQLSRLLKVNKFEEALTILNNKIPLNEKMEQLENYYFYHNQYELVLLLII